MSWGEASWTECFDILVRYKILSKERNKIKLQRVKILTPFFRLVHVLEYISKVFCISKMFEKVSHVKLMKNIHEELGKIEE